MRSFVEGKPAHRPVAKLLLGLLLSSVAASSLATVAEPAAPARKPAAAATAKKPAAPAKQPAAAPAKSGPRGPQIRSSAVLVVDESDSSILLSKNADVAMPIASITKLMTALVVIESGQPLDEIITITKADRAIDQGSLSRLAAGAKLARSELIHLALMSSENQAAHALGRTYEGGFEAVLRAMNAKAKALGMKRSHFTDTTGLSKGNIASPADLVKLVAAAAANPLIAEYSTDPDETLVVGRQPLQYRNTNNLVRKPDWDIVVQKTGYTQAAGRCLVMKTFIEDRPVIMVLMNSFGKYTRTADAIRVRRWMEAGSGATKLASAAL